MQQAVHRLDEGAARGAARRGVGVGAAVSVGVGVAVGSAVAVGEGVAVGTTVPVGTGVAVGTGVWVVTGVGVPTGVALGVPAGVAVGVAVAVPVGVGVGPVPMNAGTQSFFVTGFSLAKMVPVPNWSVTECSDRPPSFGAHLTR